jgi:hypothetical protein
MSVDPRLHCELRLLLSPDPDFESIDPWGEVLLTIESEGSYEPLLVWQGLLYHLGDWFVDSADALCHGEFIIEGERPRSGENLAEALDRFRDRAFLETDEDVELRWFKAIEKYDNPHSLMNGLPGARMPDIVLGCHCEMGEISLSARRSEVMDYGGNPLSERAYVKLGRWSYRFDMRAFLNEMRAQLERTLSEWLAGDRDPSARPAKEKLLQRVTNVLCDDCCDDMS